MLPVYKRRKMYETARQNKLDVRACQYCHRWGDNPEYFSGESEPQSDADVPVACELLTSDRAANYEQGLAMDEFHVWSHRLHLTLGVKECGDECEIPNEKPKSKCLINSIKNKLKVEEIAERLTGLRGSGNKLNGRCPLHNEQKGRSFYVWTDTQSWYCFGQCVRGGDVLDLIEIAHELGLNWRSSDDKK